MFNQRSTKRPEFVFSSLSRCCTIIIIIILSFPSSSAFIFFYTHGWWCFRFLVNFLEFSCTLNHLVVVSSCAASFVMLVGSTKISAVFSYFFVFFSSSFVCLLFVLFCVVVLSFFKSSDKTLWTVVLEICTARDSCPNDNSGFFLTIFLIFSIFSGVLTSGFKGLNPTSYCCDIRTLGNLFYL